MMISTEKRIVIVNNGIGFDVSDDNKTIYLNMSKSNPNNKKMRDLGFEIHKNNRLNMPSTEFWIYHESEDRTVKQVLLDLSHALLA